MAYSDGNEALKRALLTIEVCQCAGLVLADGCGSAEDAASVMGGLSKTDHVLHKALMSRM